MNDFVASSWIGKLIERVRVNEMNFCFNFRFAEREKKRKNNQRELVACNSFRLD